MSIALEKESTSIAVVFYLIDKILRVQDILEILLLVGGQDGTIVAP
ncbi:hypothetical protein LEP3755_09760 [Leptolyngbya sp. NIES-3755]|nr:hypothetical protein LEP3755_09760 [Leptolyngbya sp. NIES-3755]